MARSYSQLMDRYNDATFIQTVQYAVAKAIRDIEAEPTSTPNHDKRVKWQMAAMANPAQMARSMGVWVITDPTCTGDTSPTDADVQAAVNALILRFAE